MTTHDSIDLRYTGEYSLTTSVTAAAQSGFAPGMSGDGRTVLDLALLLDERWAPVGVRLVQDRRGVRAAVVANPSAVPLADVRDQLERILSLDHDGERFADVSRRDAVVGHLHDRYPGLRPVLHPSPYEAAARAIVMHRLSRPQTTAILARIAEQHGDAVDVCGRIRYAFPRPGRLAELPFVPGLSERKVEQLRALGRAADRGTYTASTLRALTRADATARLQELAGIGPFSAELVLIRGIGDADVFPRTEKSLHRAMADAYDLGHDPDIDRLERAAETWRPYRSWVGLLLRHRAE